MNGSEQAAAAWRNDTLQRAANASILAGMSKAHHDEAMQPTATCAFVGPLASSLPFGLAWTWRR